jgi:hypothetical protein
MSYLLLETGDKLLLETGDGILLETDIDSASHTLRLLYGDKRNPTRTLDLSSITGPIYLAGAGFAPGSGEQAILWSGRGVRYDGQKRLASSRDNAKFTLKYNLAGATAAAAGIWQAEVNRFFEETKLWEEEEQGGKVWLEYKWANGLKNLPAPAWGQWSYYYQVYHAEVRKWPDKLHDPDLIAGHIAEVTLDLTCSPFAEGLDQLILNADAAPSAVNANLLMTLTTEMRAFFTVAGWTRHRAADYTAWEYYVDASNYVRVYWDNAAGQMKASLVYGGVTVNLVAIPALTAGKNVFIALSSSPGNAVALYVNWGGDNPSVHTHTADGWPGVANGQMKFGGALSTATTEYTDGLQGWKIFTSDLSSEQVSALYTHEAAILNAGGSLQPMPYHCTDGGDGVWDNVDGAISGVDKRNGGYIGGICGDVPAAVEWQAVLNLVSSIRQFWLGNKITDSALPTTTHWLDFSGTTDTGNSSGDAYQQQVTAGLGSNTVTFSATLTVAAEQLAVRGRVTVLARIYVSGDEVSVVPFYQIGGSNPVYGDTFLIAANDRFDFHSFGDLFISWPFDGAPGELTIGIEATETSATATTVRLDYLQLLPYPNWMIEAQKNDITLEADSRLYITGRQAKLATVAAQSQPFEVTGGPVGVWPRKINNLFWQIGEEAVAPEIDATATMTIYFTPRYLLPGA